MKGKSRELLYFKDLGTILTINGLKNHPEKTIFIKLGLVLNIHPLELYVPEIHQHSQLHNQGHVMWPYFEVEMYWETMYHHIMYPRASDGMMNLWKGQLHGLTVKCRQKDGQIQLVLITT